LFNPSGKLFLIPPKDDDDQRNNPRDDGRPNADQSEQRRNGPGRPVAHEAGRVIDAGRDDIEDPGNATTQGEDGGDDYGDDHGKGAFLGGCGGCGFHFIFSS
jgi:hypothetical protein